MNEFYELLLKNKMITPIWKSVISLIDELLDNDSNKDSYLKLFLIYFSLIDDGNLYMNLDKEKFIDKFNTKVNGQKILLEDDPSYAIEDFDNILNTALSLTYLLETIKDLPIVKKEELFVVRDNMLYTKKFAVASKNISQNIQRLFNVDFNTTSLFNYEEYLKESISLSIGQKKAITSGLNNNLIITGGPGTGKTTSILFLLINLLKSNFNYNVYLVAPSGKASSRMKESINNSLSMLNDKKDLLSDVIDKITSLDESTIHHLLGVQYKNNTFKYNKDYQFDENSIFVIDEASMIDVNIFNALLDAIPTNARVFIMGDKNQLPSVESGAIFGALLKNEELSKNIVELDESKRFKVGTVVYNLAKAINEGSNLNLENNAFNDFHDFKLYDLIPGKYPVYYYLDNYDKFKDKDILDVILSRWNDKFYSSLNSKCKDISYDLNLFKEINHDVERARILTAENNGSRGVKTINDYFVKDNLQFYPGELLMITKNNKTLELYNGDSGIIVKFAGDDCLYFMIQKTTKLVSENIKIDDNIFKLDNFVFYPIRLIPKDEITPSYAITIHKSQGSDYENILVILPSKKGHPLLNRQILYTAITRTKGNTYILSNIDRLNEAKDNLLVRDTII